MTQPRQILQGSEALSKLVRGARAFSKAVCTTYGPQGRTVMLDRPHGLLTTKDGVTVAREINLPDPVENMACQVFKQACIAVNDRVGDGTTSAACISTALLVEGAKLVEVGYNPVLMARGMKAAADAVIPHLMGLRRDAATQRDLFQVALIASNGDEEVAQAMAEAVMSVGKNGTVSIEDGKGVETTLVFKDGLEIDRGAASVSFLGSDTERVLEAPLVACIAATLTSVEDVQDLLEVASQFPQHPLLLFCEGIQGAALTTMSINDSQGVVKCVAIVSPGFHAGKVDYLGDLAALSGAELIDPRAGGSWLQWDPNWFGPFLRRATIQAKKSILLAREDAVEAIRERADYIRAQMPLCTSDFDRDKLHERAAALEGGLCVMQIGAPTEAELKEKRARVEDALSAVQAALAMGLLPGGAVAYLAGSEWLLMDVPQDQGEEFKMGWKAVARALRVPLITLANNAGKVGEHVVEHLSMLRLDTNNEWLGWDAVQGQYRDMGLAPMVVDPAQVVGEVIDAAVSSASTLLTSACSLSVIE